ASTSWRGVTPQTAGASGGGSGSAPDAEVWDNPGPCVRFDLEEGFAMRFPRTGRAATARPAFGTTILALGIVGLGLGAGLPGGRVSAAAIPGHRPPAAHAQADATPIAETPEPGLTPVSGNAGAQPTAAPPAEFTGPQTKTFIRIEWKR